MSLQPLQYKFNTQDALFRAHGTMFIIDNRTQNQLLCVHCAMFLTYKRSITLRTLYGVPYVSQYAKSITRDQ